MKNNYFQIFIFLFVSILLMARINVCFAVSKQRFATNRGENVVLIEYFDYECPHCRRMEMVIEQLKAQYPQLKIIQRVTPLLTSKSMAIAHFMLATQQEENIPLQIAHNIQQAEKYAVNGKIYFPIFVFKLKNQNDQKKQQIQPIILRGEQPYALLSAVVKQFENHLGNKSHAKMVHSKKQAK